MKRATKDEAIRFIKEMMAGKELVFTEHIRLILEEIFPFSWHRYCEKKNLNSNIPMDKYEYKKKSQILILPKEEGGKIMEKPIEEKIHEASNDICAQIEEYIKLALKPKPKWMPKFFYNWLIKTFCVIEHWSRPQIVILPKNENDRIDTLTLLEIGKAVKKLYIPSPKTCWKISQLYGVDIFVDDALPSDVWQLRCGKDVCTMIEKKIYDLISFMCQEKIENKEENNVAKNQE